MANTAGPTPRTLQQPPKRHDGPIYVYSRQRRQLTDREVAIAVETASGTL